MASQPTQNNSPSTGGHTTQYFSGARGVRMRDMNTTNIAGDHHLSINQSTYAHGATHNSASGGSTMYVGTPAPYLPTHPSSASSIPRQSRSRPSSPTGSSTSTWAQDSSPASSSEVAPDRSNALGVEPRNPYGSRHPGHHRHESSRTPRGPSTDGRRESGGALLAPARDDPLHPHPYGLTPSHPVSPGLESLSGFDVPSLLRGPSSLGGGDESSPEDSISVALRPPEETELDMRRVSTPPAPQVAQSDVEERVQPPTPTVPQVAEQPFPDLPDSVQAEQPKDLLEVERSTALNQGTPASGLLSLESPSRAHFNSGPSFDDQSSISDESEPDAEALARANAAAPEGVQKKLGFGKRIRLWLSRKLEGLARRVAPTETEGL